VLGRLTEPWLQIRIDSPRVSVATGLWPVYPDATQAKQDGSQSRGYSAPLFVYDLDLLIDHLAGKPIDCDVHPVALLAFDDKVILET
jgi:hypothetical protein